MKKICTFISFLIILHSLVSCGPKLEPKPESGGDQGQSSGGEEPGGEEPHCDGCAGEVNPNMSSSCLSDGISHGVEVKVGENWVTKDAETAKSANYLIDYFNFPLVLRGKAGGQTDVWTSESVSCLKERFKSDATLQVRFLVFPRLTSNTDKDSNGVYDQSTLFADGLSFPTGLLTWRGGVIVSAAPDILFLKDTDGDQRADLRRVLISGLSEGNQQLRANGLRWGLDGWVYCAAGGHHVNYGKQTKLRTSRGDFNVGARDFRFRPDTGELEPVSGPSQNGRNRHDWGAWFGTRASCPRCGASPGRPRRARGRAPHP